MKQDFSIADLNEKDKQVMDEMEKEFRQKTGKDCVMIAWEKNS